MRVALPSLFAIPLFAACVAPTPGNVRQVPDPVSTRYINPGTLAALPGFTHAVRIGSTLYISGEVALDSTGRLVGPGDLRAQAAQAFANLAAIREAAPDFFPQRNPPAGTVIGVQALPQEGLLIAVDATAVVRAMILPRDQRLQEKPY